MIKYLKRNEIDVGKWDECISNSPQAMGYALHWSLDAVCNWDALVLENYKAVMPLTWRKKMGIHYLCQPFPLQQLGIFSISDLSQELTVKFMNVVPKKFRLAEINFNEKNPENLNGIENANYTLDLSSGIETLTKSFSKNHKRNIKKAQKNEFIISKEFEPELVLNQFKENKGVNIDTLKPLDYENFLRWMNITYEKESGKTYCIKNNQGNVMASAFFFLSCGRIIFIKGSSTQEGKEESVMHFLINKVIQDHANQNLALDFAGSNNENLARFYQGFGASKSVYSQWRFNRLPFWLKWLK